MHVFPPTSSFSFHGNEEEANIWHFKHVSLYRAIFAHFSGFHDLSVIFLIGILKKKPPSNLHCWDTCYLDISFEEITLMCRQWLCSTTTNSSPVYRESERNIVSNVFMHWVRFSLENNFSQPHPIADSWLVKSQISSINFCSAIL